MLIWISAGHCLSPLELGEVVVFGLSISRNIIGEEVGNWIGRLSRSEVFVAM